MSQRIAKITREATKQAVKATKATIKATISTIKAIIAGTKALISLIVAGGWVVIVIIVVICVIGGGFIAIYNSNNSGSSEGSDGSSQYQQISIWGGDMITVAKSQLGIKGGDPYWSWYGFESRVEWCACFVSWVANQCGYLENGTIPKYSACRDAVKWFSEKNQ